MPQREVHNWSAARHETLGRRIRRIRRQTGMTQVELAAAAGINQGHISAIERDAHLPRRNTLRTIAKALGVPEGVLIGSGDGHDAPQALDTRDLPLFGTIPNGPPAESQELLETIPVLRHLWRSNRYCLRCEFDSMEPTLKRNDLILVEYRPDVAAEFVQGRICACLVDGRPTLKRVTVEERHGRRLIILRGDNPTVTPIVIEGEQPFSIQGIAVSLVSREL